MASVVYTYICTRSTVDPYIPARSASLDIFSRDVSDGFGALAGGHYVVGRLSMFPVQRSVPNHLLCNGREVARSSFPELYDYLMDSQGAPADPLKFVLPNYLVTITPAATAVPETTTEGTVTTPPPAGYPESGSGDPYGDADSGGRPTQSVAAIPGGGS